MFSNKINHASNKCLKTSEPIARKGIAKQKRLCFLCLEKRHLVLSCKLKYSCNKCCSKHNIAICTYSKDKTNPSPPVSTAHAETSTKFWVSSECWLRYFYFHKSPVYDNLLDSPTTNSTPTLVKNPFCQPWCNKTLLLLLLLDPVIVMSCCCPVIVL